MCGAPFALSDEAGLTRTCQKVLVWGSIDANLSAISYTWWESEKVAKQLKAFRRVRWPLLKVWLYPITQITSLPLRLYVYPSLRNSVWNTRSTTAPT